MGSVLTKDCRIDLAQNATYLSACFNFLFLFFYLSNVTWCPVLLLCVLESHIAYLLVQVSALHKLESLIRVPNFRNN